MSGPRVSPCGSVTVGLSGSPGRLQAVQNQAIRAVRATRPGHMSGPSRPHVRAVRPHVQTVRATCPGCPGQARPGNMSGPGCPGPHGLLPIFLFLTLIRFSLRAASCGKYLARPYHDEKFASDFSKVSTLPSAEPFFLSLNFHLCPFHIERNMHYASCP